MKQCLKYFIFIIVSLAMTKFSAAQQVAASKQPNIISLSGTWRFAIDSLDKGVKEEWFVKKLKDNIKLPGSMTSNDKGNSISINTPWTGGIVDSSWFTESQYAPYRKPGNIKVPFWLQPIKYYKGAAWYQKTVTIPETWADKAIQLFIERSHWETTVWVDDNEIGMQNSLGTPHTFNLANALTPGTHQITIRVDNRVKNFNVGENSHSISDHTQTNWNGMVGDLFLTAKPHLFINEVQVYPDIQKKQATLKIVIVNQDNKKRNAVLEIQANLNTAIAETLKPLQKEISITKDTTVVEIVYPMGEQPLLWDEFTPNLYALKVQVKQGRDKDEYFTHFGMREFAAKGTQFTINGRTTFLRGTLECAIFPKTGYPPTDLASWLRIFKIARSFGLNHMRFHSWTPPEAAFAAADQLGFYLHVECSSWANQDSRIGDGDPLDKYIYEESNRVVKAFGNHPSFCMMAYGNEPGGKHHTEYLTAFVNYWKQKDSRRLYTTAAGWPVVADNNYNSTPDPRIQGWGQGLNSIINKEAPRSDYDWASIIAKWQHPTVSHEIGQWCVYPDFKEIKKYTGVLKAKNFEIFKDKLEKNGMLPLADSFLLASGKLQALCYKADIEAALRTPGFGGFQLLDLHDFPGQGTALVGVLNPFWEEKGYITAKEYSNFCNAVVPLARFPKMIYRNNETMKVPVEIAQFGAKELSGVIPKWTIKNENGKTLFEGSFSKIDIPVGNNIKLGRIEQSLATVEKASHLIVTVTINSYQNSWDIFVYPAALPERQDHIVVTQTLDEKTMAILNKGGNVLITLKKGTLQKKAGSNIAIGFSSIFWNTAWTHGQAPHTLGILVNPKHPALKEFPTQYYSNWQWWDAMSHSNAIILDSLQQGLKPIVRVIDDWFTARPLGLVMECKVGKGKLLLSGIDLLTDQDSRPEAKQLLYSLRSYMNSSQFNPTTRVSEEKLKKLF